MSKGDWRYPKDVAAAVEQTKDDLVLLVRLELNEEDSESVAGLITDMTHHEAQRMVWAFVSTITAFAQEDDDINDALVDYLERFLVTPVSDML